MDMSHRKLSTLALIETIGVVATLLCIQRPEARADPSSAVVASPASAPTPQGVRTSDGVKLDDTERTLGPFESGNQRYTVVLHLKRIAGAPANGGSEALEALDIRDAAGVVVHHEQFGYTVGQNDFDDSCSATAHAVKGSMIQAIVIDTGCLPSAPNSGGTIEIFGNWNGTFTRIGPFTMEGEMIDFVPGPVTKIGTATSFQADSVRLRIWTGNFHVTVPLTLDWTRGQLVAPRCFEQTGQGMREGGCDLDVEVERAPVDQDLTFIRLLAEANEGFGIAKHVVVKQDSKVTFLRAHARVVLAPGEVLDVGIGDDPWLKVRIDGLEGWIHTQEDFSALGVPQAG